jgi:hypothetical protein
MATEHARGPWARRRTVALAVTAAGVLVAGGLTMAFTLPAGAAVTAAAPAAVVPGTAYTVVNGNSGKCVDARSAATANGTAVQQYTCNGTTAQQWTFTATSGGYFQVGNGNNAAQVWDVTNVSTADSAPVQLWAYGGGNNQQWQPVAEAAGTYHLVNRNSGKCLDVPAASSADSVQLQQYACNGTGAQSFALNPAGGSGSTPPPGNPSNPDLGPNVKIFDPRCPARPSRASSTRSTASSRPTSSAPSATRCCSAPAPTTQVRGLAGDTDAAGTRQGNLVLDDNGGWSSGGFLGDSIVDGQVNSGSQQQWLSRNDQWGSWTGSNWNMVFVGDTRAPAQSFPNPPDTTVAQTPTVAEKPFLYVDSAGAYQVFVPADRTNSSGTTWANGTQPGTSLPISRFYVAKPGDTAATINAALAAGQNLLFTPGSTT